MPAQATWFPRIPDLLQILRSETSPAEFTRADIELLLGVRRRRAIELLHRCAAYRRGTELVATRESVISHLKQCWNPEAAERAAAQQQRVSAALAEARHILALPTITLPPPAKLSEITFAGLPPGIRLTRSELSLRFSSAQNLVEQLFTLAQAFANDYESLAHALAENEKEEALGHGLHF